MSLETFAGWDQASKKILIILAHPDDPEFFLGGSIAKWIAEGHQVQYCLLTKGEKGSSNVKLTPPEIAGIRVLEQKAAADYLGVASVEFLEHIDGCLQVDMALRKELTGVIRKYQPDILVTCDPQHYFDGQRYINHPDHRAAGLAVVESVFPAAGNHFYYPELEKDGLLPHTVEEVWISLAKTPNIQLDISAFWQTRLNALKFHVSQIGDPALFEERMRSWLENDVDGNARSFDKFQRIILKR